MTLRRQLLRYLVNPVADNLLAWFMPKWRRRGSEALSTLRRYINYYRPHIEADKLRENETYRKDLAEALTLWDKAETERLSALILEGPCSEQKGFKRNPFAEAIESLFVILAIFLGIRTYFAQPFRIPTGSMQPTLNGIIIHPTDDSPGIARRAWDAVTLGSSYINAVAENKKAIKNIRQQSKWILFTETVITFDDGSELAVPCAEGAVYEYLRQKGKYIVDPFITHLDSAKQRELEAKGCLIDLKHCTISVPYQPGETIMQARIDAGDMVVVNRMAYHFRRPERGETFVFDTRGINTRGVSSMTEQSAGTHYIKRLCGLPGDTLSIDTPQLLINGQPATEAGISRVAACQPPYNNVGYNPADNNGRIPYLGRGDSKTLQNTQDPNLREYAALGDNTVNSLDSRYWGPVRQYNIIGPAAFTLWPFSTHWGNID